MWTQVSEITNSRLSWPETHPPHFNVQLKNTKLHFLSQLFENAILSDKKLKPGRIQNLFRHQFCNLDNQVRPPSVQLTCSRLTNSETFLWPTLTFPGKEKFLWWLQYSFAIITACHTGKGKQFDQQMSLITAGAFLFWITRMMPRLRC